ncbi:MAG: ABC transporter permease [Oscillospiraceae bacterium]|jgi:simple sugar transport system permease protein|nr:ABC transporter permease [Oscillospiraceae bacterium]
MNRKATEPFVRIVKRDGLPLWHSWLIRLAALALALAVCAAVIFAIVRLNPLRVYGAMWQGAFGSAKRGWITLRDTMMLLCIGVGLAPAFKMRFWNIGAEGQILVGGLATAACMIYFGSAIPTWALLLLTFAVSAAAGAVWGVLPAFFKARYGTNETLFTLMMNYVAIQLTAFFVAKWENPFGSNTVGIINQTHKSGWFPAVFGQQYLLNALLVLALTVFVFIYLRYTKHGYETAVVGESERTARYIGIDVRRVIIRTMLLSGAICGLAGFTAVAGASHTISTSTAGGRGFTAIIVAWLARFNTFVMILTAALLVFLEKGAIQIATQYNLNDYASQMITGIILFFILGSEFFINYRLIFRGKKEAD